jgi:hypothetical protein
MSATAEKANKEAERSANCGTIVLDTLEYVPGRLLGLVGVAVPKPPFVREFLAKLCGLFVSLARGKHAWQYL